MAEADSASIPEGGNVIAHIAISQRLLAALREPGSQVSGSRVEGSSPSGPDAIRLPGAGVLPRSGCAQGDVDERA